MKSNHRFIFSLFLFILSLLAARVLANPPEDLSPYPSPAAREQEVRDLARAHPDRVELIEYGKSVEGRPLMVLFIHRPGETNKPAGLVAGNIHGNEWIGNRMAMAIAHKLAEQDGADPLVTSALSAMNFYVAPCLNPDGYQRTFDNPNPQDAAGLGRDRKNARGVDLNRNFPIPGRVTIPIDSAGSPKPESPHYRGPRPLSEPETQALDLFFQQHPEIISALSFHATQGVIFPPHCETRACIRRHKKFSRAFQSEQTLRHYPRLQSRFFDTYTGELEDWLYMEYGVIAADVEIGTPRENQQACHCSDFFWTYNPKRPEVWIQNDAPAAIKALLSAMEITGGKRVPKGER